METDDDDMHSCSASESISYAYPFEVGKDGDVFLWVPGRDGFVKSWAMATWEQVDYYGLWDRIICDSAGHRAARICHYFQEHIEGRAKFKAPEDGVHRFQCVDCESL